MRSLPLIAVALALGLVACGRTSLFGWNDLDGGIPIEADAGSGGGVRDSGAGGTGGRATGGTGGRAIDGGASGGATGGARDGGTVDANGGRRTDGGVDAGGGTGGRFDGGATGGIRADSGVDAGTGGRRIDGGTTGGRIDGGSMGGTPTGGIGSGGTPSGGSGGTGGTGTGGSGTGGATDAGIYECDPVNQDCAIGFRCDLPDNGQFVFRCLPDQGGQGGQNQVCEDSADCIKGASCLQDTDRFGRPIGPALCTVFCYENADCPAGNHCLGTGIIGSGGDLTFGLCLPNR